MEEKIDNQGFYLGIDPGSTGAVSRVRYPDIEIFDWAGILETAAVIREWKARYEIAGAFIESVHSFPDDGQVSAFRFGKNVGAWQGILCALEIPIKTVSPGQWRKGLYEPGDRRPLKKRSLDAARALFPVVAEKYFARVMDHDRAESALMAYQAERFFEI